MQYKNIFSLLLALIMLFSVAIIGPAAAFAEEAALAEIIPAAEEVSDVDAQLALIFAKIGILKQPNTALSWYYTVTDLDHNGRLEFIAASQHPNDRSTNLKIWEVNADRTAIRECTVVKDPDESFPDILTDITDTFYDPDTDDAGYSREYPDGIRSDGKCQGRLQNLGQNTEVRNETGTESDRTGIYPG